MFLQIIVQLKILELLLDKIKKDFKISKIREISNIHKGTINKRKSIINFNFPDTPPQTPPQRPNRREFDDDEKDFPPPPHFLEPTSPRETSFFFLMEFYRH